MAKLSITGFLSKWAGKFASTGSGSITGAFMRDFRQDISDSFLSSVDYVTEASVDVSGASLSLDFDSSALGLFYGSASFATAKDLVFTNDTNKKAFDFTFEITNVAAEIGLPSDCTMQDALWERSSDNVWSPLDIGKYLMEGKFINSEWKIKITGPWS